MFPNSWLNKLNRTRNYNITHSTKEKKKQEEEEASSPAAPALADQRKSYHFTRDKPETVNQGGFYDNLPTKLRVMESLNCPQPPRKSSRKRLSTKQNRPHYSNNQSSPGMSFSSSVSAGCYCRVTLESTPDRDDNHDSTTDSSSLGCSSQYDQSVKRQTFDGMLSLSAYCECSEDNDVVIDLGYKPFDARTGESDKRDAFGTVPQLNLSPINTKPTKFDEPAKIINKGNTRTKEQKQKPIRRGSGNTAGVKLRANSPRIGSRRITGRRSASSTSTSSITSSRKDLLESFAVVKSSKDPHKDFKESMVEMIIENNMFASRDLEELLACYLSLNSDEYHDLIIKVFQQIWFDVIDPQL